MVDLLLAGAAVVLLVIVTVVLMRRERLGRGWLAGAIALIVLAAGTFAVALYRSQADKSDKSNGLGLPAASAPSVASSCGPAATGGGATGGDASCQPPAGDPDVAVSGGATSGPASSAPAAAGGPTSAGGGATPRSGATVVKVQVPMGTGDKLPQGALWLDPPRRGTDAYTGDVSLMCVSPGKSEHEQNCAGADERTWVIQPIAHRVTLGFSNGDPFIAAAACEPANGVSFVDDYYQLEADRRYCLRKKGDTHTYALRVLTFPKEKPVPARLTVEVAVLD
ncbi:hypothetical protein ACQP2F_44295 [Actinoplanes sp. CA-030573]|uniref:hypothetical protein n=1 Tax=Actinoplanes sp. CA-030573 TaxID=3239898 RepID=UPI003D8C09FB